MHVSLRAGKIRAIGAAGMIPKLTGDRARPLCEKCEIGNTDGAPFVASQNVRDGAENFF